MEIKNSVEDKKHALKDDRLTRVGLVPKRGSMGPGHIFQSFVNSPCRIKVWVMAMPFNCPPRVRERERERERAHGDGRSKVQQTFSTVLFTN